MTALYVLAVWAGLAWLLVRATRAVARVNERRRWWRRTPRISPREGARRGRFLAAANGVWRAP